MNEIIGYILKTLGKTEEALELIAKILNRQNKLNKCFVNFMILTTVSFGIDICYHKKQNEKIEALSKEIEELKNMKGE